jgi:nuclear transport factor 2 (NTF2) superfamily protein
MESVRVIYHHEDDGWWAESPDVEGWSAVGDDFPEVRNLAVVGIPVGASGRLSFWAAWPEPSKRPQTQNWIRSRPIFITSVRSVSTELPAAEIAWL